MLEGDFYNKMNEWLLVQISYQKLFLKVHYSYICQIESHTFAFLRKHFKNDTQTMDESQIKKRVKTDEKKIEWFYYSTFYDCFL